jgi:hypothetical protein
VPCSCSIWSQRPGATTEYLQEVCGGVLDPLLQRREKSTSAFGVRHQFVHTVDRRALQPERPESNVNIVIQFGSLRSCIIEPGEIRHVVETINA